jgi:hypothetical protein
MRKSVQRRLAVVLTLGMATAAMSNALSIPAESLDSQKVYYGTPEQFEKPGEVDYDAIVRATPEYEEIERKKVERGSARYWILLSNAGDHAVRLIAEVGMETEHDLIAALGYLSSLEKPIPAEDLTPLVLSKLSKK